MLLPLRGLFLDVSVSVCMCVLIPMNEYPHARASV